MIKKLIAASLLALTSTTAAAQCTKDTDCKGDRICVEGSCVDASPSQSSPAPQGRLSEVEGLELRGAQSKASTGLMLAGGTLLAGLGTAATNGEGDAPKALGGMTLVLAGAATPIAASASSRARQVAQARGIHLPQSTARLTAWSGYGLSMGLGTAVFAAGLSDQEISNGLILSLTALGALSATTMALDARSTVAAIEASTSQATLPAPLRPSAQLTASATRDGAVLGVVGSF
jgi:hypothetical protein